MFNFPICHAINFPSFVSCPLHNISLVFSSLWLQFKNHYIEAVIPDKPVMKTQKEMKICYSSNKKKLRHFSARQSTRHPNLLFSFKRPTRLSTLILYENARQLRGGWEIWNQIRKGSLPFQFCLCFSSPF